MLVISRKIDEQIVVGCDIVITVVEVKGDRIRLGFEAPQEVSVHRKEIFDAIKRSGSTRGRKISERKNP